jgi:hypothetical protein
MVATAICGVRVREHGRRWGVLWCCSACQTREGAAGRGRRHGRAAVWWGCGAAWSPHTWTRGVPGEDALAHGRHALPKGQFVEHMADASVPILEADFGLVLFIFGPKAFKQNYCLDNALQLSFREKGH